MSQHRGLFQIHLMTAIVLMFAAGGVIKLNLSAGREYPRILGYKNIGAVFDPQIDTVRAWGWPWTARDFDSEIAYYPNVDISRPGSTLQLHINRMYVNWPKLLADVGVGVLILACIAVVCELLLRRKRRPA